MKHILLAVILLSIASYLFAQNVGVNTPSPLKRLSVNGSLLVDQNNTNPGNLDSAALLLGTNGVGIFSNRNAAVTNFNGFDIWTGNARRMVVTSTGAVGINLGTLSPGYTLDVNGSIRAKSSLLSDNDVSVSSNAYIGSSAYIGGNGSIDGNLTVAGTVSVGGKGIVRSNSATNLRMGFTSGTFGITLPAGGVVDIVFNITSFTGNNGNIRVSICQFVPNAGGNDTWGRITMTVHSINDATNQCQIRFFNGSSATSVMEGTLYLMNVATD